MVRDWRLRKQSSSHHDPISWLAGKTVAVTSEACGFRREYEADDLSAVYGRDYCQEYLRYDLAACSKRKRFRECGVRYVK